ncbi:Phospholipid/glycerol acyltransferase [uncultured delta proteobacterium]|uniref:Phospholipid/glycerol acyltransferase n=1 Tax=uncultured delta proteobacterium TaxID=34034 RepID=A0A212J4M7_9DELT|nr:Phospholipid/glycerol acyltransferase [uncultured delta proteobacterium]
MPVEEESMPVRKESLIDDAVTLNPYPDDPYVTPETAALPVSSFFPNLSFYWRMCATLKRASNIARAGNYTSDDWIRSSIAIREAMEKCGTKVTVAGFSHFKNMDGPCVFIGNHMSTLETFMLPGLIRPFRPVTFVVKRSLLVYPVFSHIMRAREPIVVDRKDPRADFTAVMRGGLENLAKGISVIVFPQSTRYFGLNRQHFNSMGVKLARKANVPVVPLALRTDAWGMNGFFGLLKDHGPIHPEIPVHFRFGEPMTVTGNGKEEHERVYSFIENSLAEWGIAPETADLPAEA